MTGEIVVTGIVGEETLFLAYESGEVEELGAPASAAGLAAVGMCEVSNYYGIEPNRVELARLLEEERKETKKRRLSGAACGRTVNDNPSQEGKPLTDGAECAILRSGRETASNLKGAATMITPDETIICDTLRAMDLIPAFLAVLPENGNTAALRAEWNTFTIEDFYNGVADDFLNDPLWDAMNAAAPAGTYFGASEGNGSDFGYWTVEETDAEILDRYLAQIPVELGGTGA